MNFSRKRFQSWVAGGVLFCASIPFSVADPEAELLDSVEVVGTRLLAFDSDVFSKIEVTSAEISQSGSVTVADWLQNLPINNGGSYNFAANPTNDASARQGLNFRGLGGSASLILVNGRRVAPMGLLDGRSLPFDIGALPLGALESVEVLLDGSAAIYGADAVGGVVNLRTRREFNGGQAKVAYRQFEDTDWNRREASVVQGISRDDYSLLFSLDYSAHNDVRFGDRPVSRTEDMRAFGGRDLRSTLPYPAFVNLPATGVPDHLAGKLVGIGTTDSAGVVTWSGPVTTATPANFVEVLPNVLPDGTPRPGDSRTAFDRAPYTSMIPSEEMFGIWLSGRSQLTETVEAFADVAWRQRKQDGAIHPVTVSLRSEGAQNVGDGPTGRVILPASSPYNPFGVDLEDVRFSFAELGSRHRVFTNNVARTVVGLEGKLGSETRWTTGALWTRNKVDEIARNYITDQSLQDGLSGRLGGYINPFGPSDPGVIDRARTELRNVQDYTLQQVDARAQHTFTLGPDWVLGAGAEWRDEEFRARPTPLAEVRGYVGWGVPGTRTLGRETTAAHAELGMQEWHGWVAHAATRAEYNKSYGTAWTPQLGLTYKVKPNLLLRVRRAELFRPPELIITHGDRITYTSSVRSDPERPEEGTYLIQYTAGSNGDLDPEKTTAWRAGLVWDNAAEKSTDLKISFSADFWRYDQRGLITQFGAQNMLDVEAASPGTFADRITRFPNEPDGRPGLIERIDDSFVNINKTAVQGWDFAGNANWRDHRGGDWRLDLMATYVAIEVREDPLRGDRHFAGGPNRPHWQGNVALSYQKDNWDAALHANYVGPQPGVGYARDGDVSIDSRVFTNLSFGWNPRPKLRAGLAITNVFDVDPPRALWSNRGYSPSNYHNRGRGYALTLEKSW
ncbi:MAG: TonB-dependent receptor [Synoicihabitans sp.]